MSKHILCSVWMKVYSQRIRMKWNFCLSKRYRTVLLFFANHFGFWRCMLFLVFTGVTQRDSIGDNLTYPWDSMPFTDFIVGISLLAWLTRLWIWWLLPVPHLPAFFTFLYHTHYTLAMEGLVKVLAGIHLLPNSVFAVAITSILFSMVFKCFFFFLMRLCLFIWISGFFKMCKADMWWYMINICGKEYKQYKMTSQAQAYPPSQAHFPRAIISRGVCALFPITVCG